MLASKCTILDLPIKQIPGGTLPILLVDGKISLLTLVYIRYLKLKGLAPTTIDGKINSIALLWDFFLIYKNKKIEPKTFLLEFVEVCLFGTIHMKNDILGWKKKSHEMTNFILVNISQFSRFISANLDAIPLNPIEIKFKNSFEYSFIRDRKKTTDFLFHLDKNKKTYGQWSIRTNKRDKKSGRYKCFPVNKIDLFFANCTNIRDELLFYLLAYGGIRISEAVNLYLSDICRDDLCSSAKIKLANPATSKFEYKNIHGKKVLGTRQDYLREIYNLSPRNLISSNDVLYAGWKGMLMHFSSKQTGEYSEVRWLNLAHGEYFYQLHKTYIKMMRSKSLERHPYYFVCEDGRPLTIGAATKAFIRVCKKANINISQSGVNLHGFRHYYGFYCANVLGLDKEITKEMLHHSSLEATNNYYHISQKKINDELQKAEIRPSKKTKGNN
jgi:hypothetical protein